MVPFQGFSLSLLCQVDFPDAHVQAGGSRVQLNEIKKIPGTHHNFQIKAPKGTRLGLLAVDQSVYLLRNKNRLTKERVSKNRSWWSFRLSSRSSSSYG